MTRSKTARIAALEAAVEALNKAVKHMIDGSAGAAAANRALEAKDLLLKKIAGLRLRG